MNVPVWIWYLIAALLVLAILSAIGVTIDVG